MSNLNKTLSRFRREQSLDALRNVGNACRSRSIPSKRDKANDPRRQRKQKSWME